MGEILRLEYDALGTVFVQVNPTRIVTNDRGEPFEQNMIGPPPPETRPTFDELQAERPDLAAALRKLLDAEPFWRARATRKLQDPEALQELSNQTSREAAKLRADREQLAADRAAAEEAAAKANEEAVMAEAQRVAAEAEHAEITAKLEAARAELADLEAVKSSKTAPVSEGKESA